MTKLGNFFVCLLVIVVFLLFLASLYYGIVGYREKGLTVWNVIRIIYGGFYTIAIPIAVISYFRNQKKERLQIE